MIIQNFNDLNKYKGQVTMVGGAFDPLHQGHLEYFKEAVKFGLPVFCSVDSDKYTEKKHGVFLKSEERARILDSLRDISFVFVNHNSTASVLENLAPKYYIKGKDWEGYLPKDELEICERKRIKIIYTDTSLGSSSQILKDYYLKKHKEVSAADLNVFEHLFHQQKETAAAHYEKEYFTGDWREGGNNYLIETRRKVEGRNPELIKNIFQPQRALDVGCGPGALMCLLAEIGVKCEGIDFSPFSKALAPPHMRDKIFIGSIMDSSLPDNSYDLVICREVLEHLTLSQIKKVVENICRISSRFVYLTTRFHPSPESFVSVTDDKITDPTHITVLNKDLLRALFVLEGYVRRADLEEEMDWLKKDRVLVYEKKI